jgi:dihydroneopterin triphosphate aldolase (PTPS-III) / 6-pyruvoyltetrahydropterin synthase
LHGHNYKVGVRLLGSRQVYGDGYVVDFGDIKKVTRQVCKQLNEHFLCPTLSDVLDIHTDDKSVTVSCHVDGSQFVFPKQDCAMLPIVHATAEELAVYLWSRILEGLNASYLTERGIHTMEVIVAEAIGQEAVFRLEIPSDNADAMAPLDVTQFVKKAQPCLSSEGINPSLPTNLEQSQQSLQQQSTTTTTPPCCETCQQSFSSQLERIAASLKEKSVEELVNMTAKDLQELAELTN